MLLGVVVDSRAEVRRRAKVDQPEAVAREVRATQGAAGEFKTLTFLFYSKSAVDISCYLQAHVD